VLLFSLSTFLIAYLSLSVKKIAENNSNPHDISLKNMFVTVINFQVFIELATLTNIL
jgi:hypothetical protein